MNTTIIAHRGASAYAPENTMPAFEKAYRMGAEGLEADVQLTKDGIPVLIHDEQINRTTNARGLVKEWKWMDLKQLDAGSWFSKEYAGVSILSLEEFLQWMQPKSLYLNIELKNNKIDYEHLESIVYEMLDHYHCLERTTISTFNPNSIKRLHPYTNKVEVAFLTSKKLFGPVEMAKELGANALHVKYRLLNRRLIEKSRSYQLPIRVYTINRWKRMLHCFDLGCDGIFTDVPDRALEAKAKFYEDKGK